MRSRDAQGVIINDEMQISNVYRRRAQNYDLTVQLYNLLGFRIECYRRNATDSLHSKTGDTVVDIACGTGANFSMLQEMVGETGKIIGVDFTDAMLAQARQRVKKNKWRNVELVQSDVASYPFPARVDAVISTFGMIYVPEFDNVIRKGSRALVAGGALGRSRLQTAQRLDFAPRSICCD